MTQNKLAGQVPGERLWKKLAVLVGVKERERAWWEKWDWNHMQREESGFGMDLMKWAKDRLSWC